MRFLADESCDFGVVKALRKAGYAVKAIAEMMPGISDDEVAGLSVREHLPDIIVKLVQEHSQMLYSRFVIVQPKRIRITGLPIS